MLAISPAAQARDVRRHVVCGEPEPKHREQKAHEAQQVDRAGWPHGADEYAREYPERSLGNRAAKRCAAQEEPPTTGGENAPDGATVAQTPFSAAAVAPLASAYGSALNKAPLAQRRF